MTKTTRRRRWAGAIAAVLALGLAPLAAPAAAASGPDVTSALERRRVDTVPTPALDWRPCEWGECARVRLPLDYDQPRGASVEVALTRIPARRPDLRIGSLFLNPGGPGMSGTQFPQRALAWLGDDVQDRFDLIGMDPRGTNDSTTSRCFRSPERLDAVTGVLTGMGFPVTDTEERDFIRGARAVATSCSGPGRQMASAMSTAQVARDMDVLRRAVGDRKLSFLGFSYGTYLGQVYANLFPDRVRALVIDGVVDPTAWVGSARTAGTPISVRMNSAPASWAALDETLRRCAASGACPIADPHATLARVTDALKRQPLTIDDPENGPWELTYQQFVSTLLYSLYGEAGPEEIPGLIAMVDAMQQPEPAGRAARGAGPAREYGAATRRAVQHARGYDNSLEQVPIVMCSDSRNPRRADAWERLADREDARAPYFGRHWLWGSVYCAQQHWRATDEDAYAGPFTKVTSAPVLVIGNEHDPATSYASAVAVSRLIPRSRLLSSNNWGHTAYGVSACATAHADRYLVAGTLPPAGTRCTDGAQPFG
ncbi:alpha/beta hydrolase [Propioniciclava coleopterorum]|uniref:Alpha/beta hydrolase n=1 Tax=Propioniciclava coleopterorum TaxID=2714937 RepID=A0A6G7Y6R5_9ACTN|nr:alpha/beta hydrolase [Propioniciclava coleopterorum]QIK72338.1 alpha/beta hydrolase [Propioniciclava coleopterorum]